MLFLPIELFNKNQENHDVYSANTCKFFLVDHALSHSENFLIIGTNPVIRTVNYGLLSPSLWQVDKTNSLSFPHKYRQGNEIRLRLFDNSTILLPEFALLNLYLSSCFINQNLWDGTITLKAKEIIQIMKWSQLKRLSNSQKINKLLDCLQVLGGLYYEINWKQWINVSDTRKLIDLSHSGLLWQFQIDHDLNKRLDKNTDITIKIGKWGQYFLNLSAARHQQGLYQIGYLPRQIFEISRYHYDLALRIALYISIESRINPSHTYSLKVLLQSKYSVQEINHIFNDPKKRYQLRQSLEKSLRKLQEMNWSIKILSPLIMNNLWFGNPKIYIKSDAYFAYHKQTKSQFITGEEIKKLRSSQQLTQQQLADKVMVSKTTISKIENGKLIPSSPLLKDLLNHLIRFPN